MQTNQRLFEVLCRGAIFAHLKIRPADGAIWLNIIWVNGARPLEVLDGEVEILLLFFRGNSFGGQLSEIHSDLHVQEGEIGIDL